MILQLIPFIRLFFQTKYFLLAVTNRRVIILRLKRERLFTLPSFKSYVASISHKKLERLKWAGKSLRLSSTDGQTFSFSEMSEYNQDRFGLAVKATRQHATA